MITQCRSLSYEDWSPLHFGGKMEDRTMTVGQQLIMEVTRGADMQVMQLSLEGEKYGFQHLAG